MPKIRVRLGAELVAQRRELFDLSADPGERVEIYHRLGKINQEYMGDVEAAEQRYVQSLELDPTYVPSMNQLRSMRVRSPPANRRRTAG